MAVKPMFCLSFAHSFILSSHVFHIVGVSWLLGKQIFPKAVYFASMYRYIQIQFNKTTRQTTLVYYRYYHIRAYKVHCSEKYIQRIQKR